MRLPFHRRPAAPLSLAAFAPAACRSSATLTGGYGNRGEGPPKVSDAGVPEAIAGEQALSERLQVVEPAAGPRSSESVAPKPHKRKQHKNRGCGADVGRWTDL